MSCTIADHTIYDILKNLKQEPNGELLIKELCDFFLLVYIEPEESFTTSTTTTTTTSLDEIDSNLCRLTRTICEVKIFSEMQKVIVSTFVRGTKNQQYMAKVLKQSHPLVKFATTITFVVLMIMLSFIFHETESVGEEFVVQQARKLYYSTIGSDKIPPLPQSYQLTLTRAALGTAGSVVLFNLVMNLIDRYFRRHHAFKLLHEAQMSVGKPDKYQKIKQMLADAQVPWMDRMIGKILQFLFPLQKKNLTSN